MIRDLYMSVLISMFAATATFPFHGSAEAKPAKLLSKNNGEYFLERGHVYENGNGVPKDISKACDWYEQAAKAGSASGMNYYGVCFGGNGGRELNYANAASWYLKAFDAGYVHAARNLAVLIANGLGTKTDPDAAAAIIAAVIPHDAQTRDELKSHPNDWPVSFRAALHRILIRRGFLTGTPDGKFGPRTYAAIDRLSNN